MANPQIEDGHIRVATEIWDRLCKIRISGEARQVLDFIIRKTYGWNKKSDIIALSQFAEGTGIIKPHIIRAISKLKNMNLITVTKKGNQVISTYCFNKDYETWKSLPKKVTLPKKVISVTKKGNKPLPKKVPTITNITTITKETPEIDISKFNEYVSQIYDFFILTLSERERHTYEPKSDKEKFKWYDAIEKCHRIDGYEYWKIIDIIEHYREDEFWATRFYSPKKLREKSKNDIKRIDEWACEVEEKINLYPPDNEEDYICQQVEDLRNKR